MDKTSEPPERSGGVNFDQSDAHAQDVIGRDKIELNLPPIARKGCYAQLSENIRFAVFLGVLLFLIYAFFETNLPMLLREPTPTPTAMEVATATLTMTPEPEATATGDGPAVETTPSLSQERTATVVSPTEGTPVPESSVTSGPTVIISPTPTPTARQATATPTRSTAGSLTPAPRPPTPTPRPTPTPLSPTPVSGPPPSPTPTPPPPTPTPSPPPACSSTAVRLGPMAQVVTIGDKFFVSARVSCAVDLAGYQVTLSFDPSVVVVQSVDDGGFLASAGGSVFVAGPDIDNNAGSATIGVTVLRPGPYPDGSGTLATIALQAVGRGSSELDLSVGLSDVNGRSIPVDVTGGAAIVQPRPTATPP